MTMPGLDALPAWLRVIGRSLRALSYALALGVGVGDVLFSSDVATAVLWAVLVWSIPCVVLGVVGAVAVVLHRWRWEWIVSFWLAAALAIRSIAVWSIPGPPPPLSDGSLVTLAAVLLLLRGIDLTVFAVRTSAHAVVARGL